MGSSRTPSSLPRSLWSPQGPVKVTQRDLSDDNLLGCWEPTDRYIAIHDGACKETKWSTLFHEITEMILWDSGLHNILPHDTKEAVCDAVGGYFAAALAAGYVKLTVPRKGQSE